MKKLMLGNEAVARGAYEAGVTVCASYPGTPSTEITENIVKYEEIYAECDYITVHVPLVPDTKGMLNAAAFAAMKDGVRILNFSRADLAVADDIKAGLASGKIASYDTIICFTALYQHKIRIIGLGVFGFVFICCICRRSEANMGP